MEPNNPYQPIPSGIDYLNHIATPPTPAGPSKKSKLIIGGIILAGMLVLSVILIAATNSAQSEPAPMKIAARLHKIQTVSDKFSGRLRATALQDANSSLSAIMITANQSIKTTGVDPGKQQKELATIEPSDDLVKRLDDAYLNSQLDATYAREMYFLIEDTMTMMDSAYRQTNSAELKTFLEKTHADFSNLKKRFETIVKPEST